MSDQRVRIGIVGAGNNTRTRHIPGLKAIPGVEIVSVANRSRESGARVAAEFGIARVYDSWQELVRADDIDAVCIGTWPNMHCPVTVAALEAGKHVLCEARMAMNAAEAKTMLAASRKRPELIAQIVPSPRTLEVDSTIQELLKSGYLGPLLALELNVAEGLIKPDAAFHWRQDKALSGFNILSMGIWYEGIQRWLGQATSVMAMGLTAVSERRDAAGNLKPVTVPDHVDILAKFREGTLAHMRFTTVAGFAPPTDLWLFGRDGTLRFDLATRKLYGAQRGGKALEEIVIPADKRIGWRVEAEFISAIRGHEKITRTGFEEGVLYMEFTEAVSRSMAEGRAVALPL
ncbi:MAG: Gfo/Idh/MocA family oxidoreductase [Pseudomonadota bacterium]